MGDEYQLRRDIDKIYDKTYNYDENIWNIYTKDEINEKLSDEYYDKGKIDDLIGSSGGGLTFDDVYPIGSIYMSVNSTSPSVLFGGTWVQLQDTFLYATSTTADANSTTATDGEATHLLTASESGQKNLGTITSTGGNHTHNYSNYYYLRTQNKTDGVTRNSSAGATGTKVENLLKSDSGVARDGTPYSGDLSVSTKINGSDATSSHNNMPPYLKVFMWKRTA